MLSPDWARRPDSRCARVRLGQLARVPGLGPFRVSCGLFGPGATGANANRVFARQVAGLGGVRGRRVGPICRPGT